MYLKPFVCLAAALVQGSQQEVPSSRVKPHESVARVASPMATSPSWTLMPFSEDPTEPITFSEFSLGTFITDQYASKGIIFGGSSPFITQDSANPTSPVLSGSPRFEGSIEGRFVSLDDPTMPAIVESFTMDAGYFDELLSTRIEWFDPDGTQLGSMANSTLGIERFEISGGNIASWRISIFANEPAGFAIDNFSSVPVGSSILFRELAGDAKDGTWGFLRDEIPGFDHTALNADGDVYESHPGYSPGTYTNDAGDETVSVTSINGVQQQHSRGTFKHDSQTSGTNVVDFEEIPIPRQLARDMAALIETRFGSPFQFIDASSLEHFEQTCAPTVQKGGDGAFTCVGLVEWAAEQAGQGGGQGFINDSFESVLGVPLLSPQLLNYAMKTTLTLDAITQWLQGLFDPVDFMITDPIGRKIGFTQGLGFRKEVPRAFYPGKGKLQQFLIPRPVAGTYRIDLEGLDAPVQGALGTAEDGVEVNEFLGQGEASLLTIRVPVYAGAPGDVTRDGTIDELDVAALTSLLHTFTNDPADPADIDLDGKIDEIDAALLTSIMSADAGVTVLMDIRPGDGNGVINLKSRGVIPVAVLTTPEFDASTIDISTVRFGPGQAVEAHRRAHLSDVDGDGDLDVILHFRTQDSGIQCGDTSVSLTGSTADGTEFSGTDTIVTKGCP